MIIENDKKTMNVVKWIMPFTGMWTVFVVLIWLLTEIPMMVYRYKSVIIITVALLSILCYKRFAPKEKVWLLYVTILAQWVCAAFWFAYNGYLTVPMPILPVYIGLILPYFIIYTIICGSIVLTFMAKRKLWRILGYILIIVWLFSHKTSAYALDMDITLINERYVLTNYITLQYGWCILLSYFVIERRSGKVVMYSDKGPNKVEDEPNYCQGDDVVVRINEKDIKVNIRVANQEYLVIAFQDEPLFDDDGTEIRSMSVTPDEFREMLDFEETKQAQKGKREEGVDSVGGVGGSGVEPVVLESGRTGVVMDTKGNPIYHQSTIEATLESLRSDGLEADGDIIGFADMQIDIAKKSISKANKSKIKGTLSPSDYIKQKQQKKDAIDQANSIINYWQEVIDATLAKEAEVEESVVVSEPVELESEGAGDDVGSVPDIVEIYRNLLNQR